MAVIHSMRCKAIARLGFSYDQVVTINPAIIYTNCYGYGRRGPDRDLPAYDDTIQAECGLPIVQEHLTGDSFGLTLGQRHDCRSIDDQSLNPCSL